MGRIVVLLAAGTMVLLPAELIALVLAPSDLRQLATVGVTELLMMIGIYLAITTMMWAAVGAQLGRSAGAAFATGLAAFAFAIGIGHNAPLLGHGWVAAKMWTIMLSVTACASVALVMIDTRLLKGRLFIGRRWLRTTTNDRADACVRRRRPASMHAWTTRIRARPDGTRSP